MTRGYRDSEWAVRRWDWFNEGRIVEPLSFCQFWRTVLLYATIKWLLAPIGVVRAFVPDLTLPGVRTPPLLAGLSRKAGHLLLWAAGRLLRLFFYPLRLFFRPAGRLALTGLVNIGEPVVAFGKAHEQVVRGIFIGAVGLFYGGVLILILIAFFLENWLWTSVAIAALIVGLFAIYGFVKSGALRLLWEAVVAAKHGICPPVRIEREPQEPPA